MKVTIIAHQIYETFIWPWAKWVVEFSNLKTGDRTEPDIGPNTHTHTLDVWVCDGGCQRGRLSSSRITGCVTEETLNCECLPSAGSSSSQRCPLTLLFWITIRWSVLLNQAGPESTSLANPRRHRSTLNSNTAALRTNTLAVSPSPCSCFSLSLCPLWLQHINCFSPSPPLTFHRETWNWSLGIKNQSCYRSSFSWIRFWSQYRAAADSIRCWWWIVEEAESLLWVICLICYQTSPCVRYSSCWWIFFPPPPSQAWMFSLAAV